MQFIMLRKIHMQCFSHFFNDFAASACSNVKQSAIVNCFKHCFEKEELHIEPVEVPPGFTRAAWESQIDMEDYSEQDVEDEIQALIEKGASMDPDMQTHEEKDMTAARRIRELLQVKKKCWQWSL